MNARNPIGKIESIMPSNAAPRLFRLKSQPDLSALAFEIMKIIPAAGMIKAALESGELVPNGLVVESSSGTLALGLGLVKRLVGFELTIVSDPSVDEPLRHRLRDLGVRLEIVEATANSADVQTLRLQRLQEILDGHPGAFWPRQYENPQNALSYRGIAELVVEELGVVDTLVASVGSGGSSCGLARCLREANPSMRLVGVDTPGSAIFGLPKAPRHLRGLGSSLVPKNVEHEAFDEVHWLDAPTAFLAARQLQAEEGLFYGPTSGATWHVARYLIARDPGQRIVCVFPDTGHRYIDTAFDVDWLAGQGLLALTGPIAPSLAKSLADVAPPWSALQWNRRSLDEVTGNGQ